MPHGNYIVYNYNDSNVMFCIHQKRKKSYSSFYPSAFVCTIYIMMNSLKKIFSLTFTVNVTFLLADHMYQCLTFINRTIFGYLSQVYLSTSMPHLYKFVLDIKHSLYHILRDVYLKINL